MKLVRYGNPGREKPGLIDGDGKMRDLSALVPDIGPAQLSDAALAKLRKVNPAKLPLVRGTPRYGCPVNGVSFERRACLRVPHLRRRSQLRRLSICGVTKRVRPPRQRGRERHDPLFPVAPRYRA